MKEVLIYHVYSCDGDRCAEKKTTQENGIPPGWIEVRFPTKSRKAYDEVTRVYCPDHNAIFLAVAESSK